MWVNVASSGDWTVRGLDTKLEKAFARLKPTLVRPLIKTLKTANPIIHSSAILSSAWVKKINASDADVIHLHWVAGEMLSIADIGKIQKPIVWTLHDMWVFCGAEHYTEEFRWQDGYKCGNRPAYESGFDLNRWVWERKRKHWKSPIQIVAPSLWLADCARESALIHGWPVNMISYPIDIELWKPIERNLARDLLGLPPDVPLLLFGAMGGGRDPRKGFDLLTAALERLRGKVFGLELVVFGQLAPQNPPDLGYPVHYVGHLHDDLSLRTLYSAANAFALPSRQDNLPLTCMESLACGTPVIAFDASGAPTMIKHKETGFLAKAFDSQDFADGIEWVVSHSDPIALSSRTRDLAVQQFQPSLIAQQYLYVYSKASAS